MVSQKLVADMNGDGRTKMLPEEKWKQFGLPNAQISGIVIHNTNNQSKSAVELEKWMMNTNESRGTHYLIDKNETRQVMPLDWSVFNTGMGLDFGNLHCISIEIVSHAAEKDCLKAEQRALKLIRKLMKQFSLTEDDIYFHRDFQPNVNCPAQIIRRYGNKQNFLKGE